MTSKNALHIDLKVAAREGKPLKIILSDNFFKNLEQEEVLGGDLCVVLSVSEIVSEIFKLHVDVGGVVRVQCDRCLEEVEFEVHTNDCLTIRPKGEESTTDENVRILPSKTTVYDVAWDIYEQVVLSLPIQRVHEDGQCDAEMLLHLDSMRPASTTLDIENKNN